MTEQLIKRTTITELVNAWRQSTDDIRAAFALLVGAEKRLKDTFKPDSYMFGLSRTDRRYRDYDEPEELVKELKKDAWRALVDRMEIRRVLSVKRCEELNKQLETGEGLPDIDEPSIIAMMEQTFNNVPSLIEEAVKEVFDWLRPTGLMSRYKTNTQFEIGKRVILRCLESETWNGTRVFRVSHYYEPRVTALDNVFHCLDGNGTVKTTRGPLVDAINVTPKMVKVGETAYFKFKCFLNQNLHIEFTRLDLVAKLNQVAGGMRLKPANEPETD